MTTEQRFDDAGALAAAQRAAQAFVRDEAGFAQVTTLDSTGHPVVRTMTAFLGADWSIGLVQRRVHARLAQWRHEPRSSVTWVGSPAQGSTNEQPHVFDLGLLIPRLVSVRGTAEFMPAEWTVACYTEHLTAQRARGNTLAPVRTPEQVTEELVGVRIRPVRVRLEGFGAGPQTFTWTIDDPRDDR